MLPMILPAQRPLAWRQQERQMGAELQKDTSRAPETHFIATRKNNTGSPLPQADDGPDLTARDR